MIQSFAVPDTLLLDLVEPLMDSIGWFRVQDPDCGYQYFHVTRPEEFWSEYQRRPDGWMRHTHGLRGGCGKSSTSSPSTTARGRSTSTSRYSCSSS